MGMVKGRYSDLRLSEHDVCTCKQKHCHIIPVHHPLTPLIRYRLQSRILRLLPSQFHLVGIAILLCARDAIAYAKNNVCIHEDLNLMYVLMRI